MLRALALCDRVTILRDGHYVDTKPIGEVTTDSLIQMMVGRALVDLFPKLALPQTAWSIEGVEYHGGIGFHGRHRVRGRRAAHQARPGCNQGGKGQPGGTPAQHLAKKKGTGHHHSAQRSRQLSPNQRRRIV